MQKLYCYVDETGQDIKGNLYIVAVVITEDKQDSLIKHLEEVEQATRKGHVKWIRAKDEARIAYIRRVFNLSRLKGKLSYAVYHHTTDYLPRTILATAQAITTYVKGDYKATIFVDGLPKSQVPWFGKELRHLRIQVKKVRGVRKEETNTLKNFRK
jgi:hypothetical protein